MNSFQILTDSCCDLPAELVRQLDVTVVPLSVEMEGRSYADGIDMSPKELYEFRRRYIKTGIFDTKLSAIISVLFNVRQDSDYDDFFVISKAEVLEQIDSAAFFLAEIKK